MKPESPAHPGDRVDPGDIEFVKQIKDDGFAETWIVKYDSRKWLYKKYRFRFWWGKLGQPFARKWARNEMSMCRALEGIPGTVNRYLQVDEQSFLREWVEGVDLGRRKLEGRVPDMAFFEELRVIVERIHERGIAYNDLAKKYNIIVTEDDRPVIIDYQISMRSYEGKNPVRRSFNRKMIGYLQREDLRHVLKLRRRHRPDLVSADERAQSYRPPRGGRTLRRVITVPIRTLKRAIYPSGSNETFRFSKKYAERKKGYVQK